MNARDVQSAATPAKGALPTGAGQALWRGFRGCCPACGEGRMFRAFLKVSDHCPHCGEELHHHRADDFPAYLVIVIVGHILVPIVLVVETEIAPAIWVSMTLWPLIALAMALCLLQSRALWSPSNGMAACTASRKPRRQVARSGRQGLARQKLNPVFGRDRFEIRRHSYRTGHFFNEGTKYAAR